MVVAVGVEMVSYDKNEVINTNVGYEQNIGLIVRNLSLGLATRSSSNQLILLQRLVRITKREY